MIDNFLFVLKFLQKVVEGEEIEWGNMNAGEHPLSFCWDDLPLIENVSNRTNEFYHLYGMRFYKNDTISQMMVTIEDQIDYLKKMNLISKIQFGSKLYGTNIPTSDNDYRSIYLPTLEDCVLLKAKDAWEDKSEEDTSFFSLQHLMKMASQGQSAAIELICAGPEFWTSSSPLWEEIHANRKIFFSKNMHSFIGYAKDMAGKYSSRVDRLSEMENLLKFFKDINDQSKDRLGDHWETLPESLNAVKGENPLNKAKDKRAYYVSGRELHATTTVSHVISIIQTIVDGYGERVRKAKSSELDYKALMHAFRAAYQVREIVKTGDLKFPLKDHEYLRDMRSGKINFMEHKLDQKLDDLISEVQIDVDNSNLPDRVDQKVIDNVILKAYNLS